MYDLGFPVVDIGVNELWNFDGGHWRGWVLWFRNKSLHPRDRKVLPDIYRSFISSSVACSLDDDGFGLINCFHMGDADFGGSDLSQLWSTLYLARRICMQRLSRLKATIQSNFANKALFMSLNFLKPRPPAAFGTQSLFQDFQARNFPSFSFCFHQNLLVKASILSHTFLGMLKLDMAYVGMDSATEEMKGFPAYPR